MAVINPSNAGGPPDAGLNNSNIPLIGSLFANPVGENKTAEFYRNAATLNAYRPERQQGLQNTISNRSTAYQGANNALASMYGAGGAQPPSQLTSNPMSSNMLGLQPGADVNAAGSPVNNWGQAHPAGYFEGKGAGLPSRNPTDYLPWGHQNPDGSPKTPALPPQQMPGIAQSQIVRR